MRVTQRTMQDNMLQDLQQRLGEMDRLNQQIGSGKRVESPSQDPSGAARIVRIEEVVARNEQYLKNIDTAIAMGSSTEDVLSQIYDQVVRAKSLAVEGANSASNPSMGSFVAMAEEVAGIKTAVLDMTRSKYQDQYLFSGTAAGTAPFGEGGGSYLGDSNFLKVNLGNDQGAAVNLPGDRAFRETEARGTPLPAVLDLTASPLTFQLSDGSGAGPVSITLDGSYDPATGIAQAINSQIQAFEKANGVQLNVEASAVEDGSLSIGIAEHGLGGEITVTDDPATPGALESTLGIQTGTKNVFGLLDDLKAALDSGDAERVGSMLGRLDRALGDMVAERGKLGSRQRNLEFAQERLQNNNVTNRTLREQIEGVDLPEAVTRISAEEQAYQTALAAGARIFSVSILDFLS